MRRTERTGGSPGKRQGNNLHAHPLGGHERQAWWWRSSYVTFPAGSGQPRLLTPHCSQKVTVMKNEREFFSPDAMQWRTRPQPGTAEGF